MTSSRQIERECETDVAFRVISANRQPDHATIARFLVRHRVALSDLFCDVLALCQRAGMLRSGTIAVDSTKLAANASVGQNRSYEGLRVEAQRIVQGVIDTDAREDALYGSRRGDELPDDLGDPHTRKARIVELLEQARAEREAVEAEREAMHDRQARREQTPRGKRRPGAAPNAQPSVEQQRLLARKYNVTDPDSGIVRHRGMWMQGYNVHAAVADGQVILATRVTAVSSDGGQLTATVTAARQRLAAGGIADKIDEVLADSGYWHGKQITALTDQGLGVLVPPQRQQVKRSNAPAVAQRMAEVLDTPQGKAAYQRRQQIIEPVFGYWKHIRKITRVLRRGRAAVQAEIDLIATTHNLLKLHHHLKAA